MSQAAAFGVALPRRRPRRSAEARQRRLLLLVFLAPGLAYLILMRIVPVFFTIWLSFNSWNLTEGDGPTFNGLHNYRDLLHDHAFLDAAARSGLFTVTATAIELVLGIAIALFVERKFIGRGALRAALLTPMILTPAVVGVIWLILFHDAVGPVNWLLGLVGIPPVGWLTTTQFAPLAVLLTDIWHWTPFMFLLVGAALQTIPRELFEAAAVDGARAMQTLRLITLPMIRDTILVAVVLRSMDAFELFAEPYVMTGGGPGQATETLSIRIYRTAFTFFQMGYAGAMIVTSIVVLAAFYAIYMRVTSLGGDAR
jgi:multiple sugar transport system permease protein